MIRTRGKIIWVTVLLLSLIHILCGGGHYSMRADYEVLSKSEYDKWLDKKAMETKAILDAKNGVVAPAPAAPAVDTTATTASSTHS